MSDLRTEDDLRAAIEDLGRDAPVAADVLPGTDALMPLMQRRVRWWTPVAAAAVIAALAVGLAVGFSRGGSHPRPPANGRASQLVGVQWQVSSVAGNRVADRLVLNIAPNGRFGQNIGSCSSLQGRLAISPAELRIKRVALSVGLCPVVQGATSTPLQRQQVRQQVRALKAMLTGTVAWSIQHGQLTLRKDGLATITYDRFAHSPARTRQWTFHGVGITLPASWPANAVHCSTPTANTVIFPATRSTCDWPRPPDVTAVQFSMTNPTYNPFPTPPRGEPLTFDIDGVQATNQYTDPVRQLQIVEVQIPSRHVTVTITSPSRTKAFNLEQQLYIAQR